MKRKETSSKSDVASPGLARSDPHAEIETDGTLPLPVYVGLDVAARKTQCCMIDVTGRIVRESKISTHPVAISEWMRKHGASNVSHVVLETGSMSSWLHRQLRAYG